MHHDAPIDFSLLPSNCLPDSFGRTTLHQILLSDLAKEYGTPVFVYDAAHIKQKAREALLASTWEVYYASKAFLCLELARIFDAEGLGLDVASGGELHVALKAGFDPKRILFHGNNKSYSELLMAVSHKVGAIVVDSLIEIERLDEIAKGQGIVQPVIVRVTPGVEAHTHEYVMTGQEDSKFGFSIKTGKAAKAIDAVRSSVHLEFEGIHAHIGSQIFILDAYQREIESFGLLVETYDPRTVNVGGGLGVAYMNGEVSPTFNEWALGINKALHEINVSQKTRIIIEPGRSLIASAALTLYTVGTIKELEGLTTYASVDGGMSDNPRPVLYGSGYESFIVDQVNAPRPQLVTVVGKHCESGDVVVRDAKMPSTLTVGDVIATPVTGAYGYSMASNYNRVPRPPVVFVDEDGAKVVIRGETFDDLTRLEI